MTMEHFILSMLYEAAFWYRQNIPCRHGQAVKIDNRYFSHQIALYLDNLEA